MLGFIMYQGASLLDGAPIAVIATLNSSNRKTGAMIQTWVIRTDLSPTEALRSAADASVCGACPHRQSLGGACFVNVGHAPNSVYRAYKRGRYATYAPNYARLIQGRPIRFGAYGDPAAAPVNVWKQLAALASHTTGYTHQRNAKGFDPAILDYVMVSADTPRQAAAAHAAGLRTFRVKTIESPLLPNEIECLADTDGLTCLACGLCDSANTDRPSVAINVHGSRSSTYAAKYARANLIAIG